MHRTELTIRTDYYSESERRQYEESRKDHWDYYSTVATAEKKGRAEGKAETNIENARKMKAKGYAISDIAEITGLTEEKIGNL